MVFVFNVERLVVVRLFGFVMMIFLFEVFMSSFGSGFLLRFMVRIVEVLRLMGFVFRKFVELFRMVSLFVVVLSRIFFIRLLLRLVVLKKSSFVESVGGFC